MQPDKVFHHVRLKFFNGFFRVKSARDGVKKSYPSAFASFETSGTFDVSVRILSIRSSNLLSAYFINFSPNLVPLGSEVCTDLSPPRVSLAGRPDRAPRRAPAPHHGW